MKNQIQKEGEKEGDRKTLCGQIAKIYYTLCVLGSSDRINERACTKYVCT